MLEKLQHLYTGDMMSRGKRRLAPLEEGFSQKPGFEIAGSCSVGGGTLRTFDGYSNTLTAGPCTYALALDKSISKLVVYGVFDSHNDGKYANHLSSIAVYIDRTALVLGEDFDINYAGIGYDSPAVIDDKLWVWTDEHYIYAEAPAQEVKLRWDPMGQLQIAVGARYQGDLIGLCGLFNGDDSEFGEHNSLEHTEGNIDMDAHEFAKGWAISDCFHEEPKRVQERIRNCDESLYTRLCSTTHAAPGLAECLRDETYGHMYQQECVDNLCLCDKLDSCLYSETLRISNECYDRLGLKIDNAELRSYLDTDHIQQFLPKDHEEVPTEDLGVGNMKSYGEPYSYMDFNPGGSCYIYGHSHIQTLDGVTYNTEAHGCTYPLALEESIQEFTVYGTFAAEKESGQLAASLRYVSFFDIRNGKRVQLGRGLEVNYEGTMVKLPYNSEFVSIWYDSDLHHVYVYDHSLGVELRWDGQSVLRIRLSDTHIGTTKGLCGTFNGVDSDELNLLRSSGVLPTSYQAMVQEWQLPSCNFNPVPYTTDKCEPSLEDYLVCRAALTDVKFSFCVTELAPIHFIERCEQDLCKCDNDEECKCDIVSAYAQMCHDILGAEDLLWRSADFCPHNLCSFKNNGCQHMCAAPGICTCEDGFSLGEDGKSCLVDIITDLPAKET